jgi:oligopeptide/dipeptide ABC transporter ATP-binding protein
LAETDSTIRAQGALSSSGEPVLRVEDLEVSLRMSGQFVRVVRGITLMLWGGKTVALVGESGSGKSVTALSILGLAGSRKGRRLAGSVTFRRRDAELVDLLALDERRLRAIRGGEIAMIFQEPMTALNPVMRIRDQIAELLLAHGTPSRGAAYRRALEMLNKVGIPEARTRMKAYPHQLSGGMRQRVMIAMALACNPVLLIADEPTTALDVTIQAQVLELLRDMQDDLGTAILLITHDLGVVAENADRVIVMYAGTVMEDGPTRQVIDRPRHPYTRALLRSIPRYRDRNMHLAVIPGTVATPGSLPQGCVFHPRCEYAVAGRCDIGEPALEKISDERSVRCLRWREIENGAVPE